MNTESNTYPVGTSRAGTTHKPFFWKGNFTNRAHCMDGVTLNPSANLYQMRKVEQGATPSGKLCKKCFPVDGAR